MHKLVDNLIDRLPHHHWPQTNAKELEPLVQHTVLAAMKGQSAARDLANVAYGAAGIWKSVGVVTGQQDEQLFRALARTAERRMDKFNV